MARNKVQFQKSMSIHTFIQRYSDEAQCQPGRDRTLLMKFEQADRL
ncbi:MULTISPECIES: hypothetical protein [unclassified Aeromonas]|nr:MULTISPECIES: hypothetical protein [unclassified Aeromonas]